MTRNEFLLKFRDALKKRNIVDVDDIISEYEQHFAFKMADGYSEEEIAARLGNPAVLASQFDNVEGESNKKCAGKKIITITGLCFADILAGIFFIILMAWVAVVAAFSISNLVVAFCLFYNNSPWSLIPPMPYSNGVIFGLSFLALSVLSGAGSIYFSAFIHQLIRSFGRFHQNTIAVVSGNGVLPSLAKHPQLPGKINRRIRSVALFSLVLFVVFMVIGVIASMISSGSLEFWHAWGWFGYPAVN